MDEESTLSANNTGGSRDGEIPTQSKTPSREHVGADMLSSESLHRIIAARSCNNAVNDNEIKQKELDRLKNAMTNTETEMAPRQPNPPPASKPRPNNYAGSSVASLPPDSSVKQQEDALALNTIIAERASNATAELLAAKSRQKTEAYIAENYAADNSTTNRGSSEATANPRLNQNSTASQMEYNNRGQPVLKKSLPTGAQRPGAYQGAPGAEYNRVGSIRSSDLLGVATAEQDTNAGIRESASINNDDIKEAMNHEEVSKGKRKYIVYFTVGTLLLVVAIVAIVVGVVVTTSSSNGSKEATTEPVSDGPPTIHEVFPTQLQSFPANTVVTIESGTGRAPQVKAFNWLVEDPNWTYYSEAQRVQRFALATFYYGTNGDQWLKDTSQDNNWLDYNTHECEWLSFHQRHLDEPVCHDYEFGSASLYDHYDYTTLALSGDPSSNTTFNQRVRGHLVPELALLTSLEVLDVGYQLLKGRIPSELGLLSNSLRRIVLYSNSLTGMVPASLFTFPEDLWLNGNQFDGATIPTEVGLNSQLDSLLLRDAGFIGTIPKELFLTGSNFTHLNMANNWIEGSVPTEIGLSTGLMHVQLSVTWCSGGIPSELGLLNQLTFLELIQNQFRGSLPTELGNLVRLTSLDVMGNKLEGGLPSELGRLQKLEDLKVSFAGLRMRDLTGTIPMEYFRKLGSPAPSFPRLRHLWIEDTDLNGTIPTEIAWMTNLETIRLGWNRQTSSGTLPSELGLVSNLTELSLAGLKLQSTIPTEFGLLGALERFDVSDNDLTGGLPTQLGTWNGLLPLSVVPVALFSVQRNDGLEGPIPSRLCSAQHAEFGCTLGGNSLCGCTCGTCA